MSIAYFYLSERNPLGAVLPGVPLADLSTEEFAGLPPHVRQAVNRCRFYQSAEARDRAAQLAPIAAAPRSDSGLAVLQGVPISTPTESMPLNTAAQEAARSMTPVIAALETGPIPAPPKPAPRRGKAALKEIPSNG